MRPLRAAAALASVLVLVLTVSSCAGDEAPSTTGSDPATASPSETSPAPTPTEEPSEEPSEEPAKKRDKKAGPGTTITTGDSPFGPMLFDEANQAIYIWELEPTETPTCYDDCEVAWPPVLTKGEPVADGDVRPGLLGTTERRDGSLQVTYGGHPLYYYAHEAPGEVKCHNVSTHGGLWWVIRPDGDRAP